MKKYFERLDKLFLNFIWNNRKPLVSKNTLIQWPEYGGLKMVYVKHVVLSEKIMWFKRFGNSIPAKWKVLAQELMGIKKINIFKQQSIQKCRASHQVKILL